MKDLHYNRYFPVILRFTTNMYSVLQCNTTTTLSRRLTYHLQSGVPEQHHAEVHGRRLSRKDLVENTTIITQDRSRRRLRVLEAVLIRERLPTLNTQRDCQGILTLSDAFPGLRPGT